MKGALAAACLALTPATLFAWPSVELEPGQDNTLYETAIDSGETQNELSNGAGSFLFIGRTGFDGGFKRRRALLKFELAALPPGAEILAAELTLYQSKAAPGSPPASVRLHRVTQQWGEGVSEGIPPEGQGNFAEPGDATWHHRLYPDALWDTAGGSYADTASASATVGQELGAGTWPCTAALLADLLLWQSDPGLNFGWIMIGGEEGGQSAHRFNSRENTDAVTRPRLRITYRPAGSVLIDGFEGPVACE